MNVLRKVIQRDEHFLAEGILTVRGQKDLESNKEKLSRYERLSRKAAEKERPSKAGSSTFNKAAEKERPNEAVSSTFTACVHVSFFRSLLIILSLLHTRKHKFSSLPHRMMLQILLKIRMPLRGTMLRYAHICDVTCSGAEEITLIRSITLIYKTIFIFTRITMKW